MKKRRYTKGMTLNHKASKQVILFGKWQTADDAICLTKDKQFVTLSREILDTDYVSPNELEKAAKEKRRGQGW